MHDECPAKGMLMRSSKSPYTDIRSFYHGNVVDLAMRRWLLQDSPEPGWMTAQVDALFDEAEVIAKDTGDGVVKWKSATDKAETREFCRELVKRLEPILARYALPFTWDPAKRFKVPVRVTDLRGEPREILLVGEMDLLVQDRDGLLAVWDLKATRDNQYYKKVLGQLAFYALAVRLEHGRYPAMTGLIQPMCDRQVLPVTVDAQALREMAARIERTARDIWAGNLAPKADNKDCGFCAVQHVCPKFERKSGRVPLGTRPLLATA
jgi:hypothetical protein